MYQRGAIPVNAWSSVKESSQQAAAQTTGTDQTIASGKWEKVDPAETTAEAAKTDGSRSASDAQTAEAVIQPGTLTKDDSGRITAKQLPEQEQITMLFGGDVQLADGYAPMYKLRARANGAQDCFSPETMQTMQAADIFMLNNEFTYTNRGTPTAGKKYTFRAKPDNIKVLDALGTDIVSTANNHSYDYGEVSLLDTIDTLNKDEMPFVGSGHNLAEASQPVIFQNSRMKIAYLSATQIERLNNPDTKGATDTTPGVFRCWQADELLKDVQAQKAAGCFVVAYVHWGTESTPKLDSFQTKLADELVQAGADLIIGDHPHVLQGIDLKNGVPVIYSLGNYWFNSGTTDTCLVRATVQDGRLTGFQFLPARQANCYTALLSGNEKSSVLAYMRTLSPNVTIDDDGNVALPQ